MDRLNQTLVDRDLDVLWHPASHLRDYHAFPPIEIIAASGCRLRLNDGRDILDAISSWWCKSLGHGHPRLRAALIEQAERFEHVIIANTTNQPIVRLCERLLAMANGVPRSSAPSPPWFSKVFFADSGSTGVEVALKMALQAQVQLGNPSRTRFAALANGYHGETIGALSVGDCAVYKDTYRSLLFPCQQLGPLPLRSGPDDPRWQDAGSEWAGIEQQLEGSADQLAAIIYEPVLQAAGNMRLYSPDLLRRLRMWADAHDVLLIADEIAAGMGRCGAMLASHLGKPMPEVTAPGGSCAWHLGILPDLAVISKGLTGGVLPLAAVLTTHRIHGAFDGEWPQGRDFLHSSTFAGNALAVAVAHAVLDVFAQEDVLGMVAVHGQDLHLALQEVSHSRPYLHQVRGLGMMVAVDLRTTRGEALPAQARSGWRICREALTRGALMRPLGDTIYLMPPLNTVPADLRRMLDILADSCAAVFA